MYHESFLNVTTCVIMIQIVSIFDKSFESQSKYMEATTTKKRKTVILSTQEFTAFKAYTRKFNTLVEAAEAIGIHRNVLDRVFIVKRASQDTVTRIRAAIATMESEK